MTLSSPRNKTMVLICLLILGGTSASSQQAGASEVSEEGNIAPIRVIWDRYPMYAGVAVDSVNDKVVMTDDNHFGVLLYDRNVPGSTEEITEYRRKIEGPQTRLSSVCGVALDPATQEMYVLNTDFGNNMLVFSYEQSGNSAPLRELAVDHGGWGIFLDREVNNELYFSIQHLNKISVYHPDAQGRDTTVRYIQGPQTKLVDPHGIFVDTRNDEIVVTNHHSSHQIETGVHAATLNFRHMLQSTGRYELASVTVYERTAEGDAAPLRTIQGPRTRLNLPLGVAVDHERDVIIVANDQTHSILFFPRTAQGNVAPSGVIEGSATLLRNPGALQIDPKNQELWVTNWGDHSVTIYSLDARGDVAPLRSIRSAPRGEPLAGLGTPSAIAWDSRRDQLLVPN
jgi:DNA-binding beta-propeller fold protein YncE